MGTEGAQTGSVPLWFTLQLAGQEICFYTSSSAMGFLGDLEQDRLVSLEKGNCKYFFSFP